MTSAVERSPQHLPSHHLKHSNARAAWAGIRLHRSAIGDNGSVTCTASGSRPQLVIFDLDGTLTDSADGIVASFRHALASIGAEVPRRPGRTDRRTAHAQTLQGMGLGERRRGHRGLPGRLHQPRLGLQPALRRDRPAAGRPACRRRPAHAVATSKAEPTARRILDHFGLTDHFEVIAGASDRRFALEQDRRGGPRAGAAIRYRRGC